MNFHTVLNFLFHRVTFNAGLPNSIRQTLNAQHLPKKKRKPRELFLLSNQICWSLMFCSLIIISDEGPYGSGQFIFFLNFFLCPITGLWINGLYKYTSVRTTFVRTSPAVDGVWPCDFGSVLLLYLPLTLEIFQRLGHLSCHPTQAQQLKTSQFHLSLICAHVIYNMVNIIWLRYNMVQRRKHTLDIRFYHLN